MENTPKNLREQQDYLSYLLRLWRVHGEDSDWHASLESSQTGGWKSFASLDDLFEFLRSRTRGISSAFGSPDGSAADSVDPP